jgi:hypothetical protein
MAGYGQEYVQDFHRAYHVYHSGVETPFLGDLASLLGDSTFNQSHNPFPPSQFKDGSPKSFPLAQPISINQVKDLLIVNQHNGPIPPKKQFKKKKTKKKLSERTHQPSRSARKAKVEFEDEAKERSRKDVTRELDQLKRQYQTVTRPSYLKPSLEKGELDDWVKREVLSKVFSSF